MRNENRISDGNILKAKLFSLSENRHIKNVYFLTYREYFPVLLADNMKEFDINYGPCKRPFPKDLKKTLHFLINFREYNTGF